MKFCDKVRSMRREFHFTQSELAEKLGVSLRTVTNYETGQRYPQRREIYDKLGEIFHVHPNYFLSEDEGEELMPRPIYPSEPQDVQMNHLVRQVTSLFAGGRLSEHDKDAVMRALTEAYWDSKQRQKA